MARSLAQGLPVLAEEVCPLPPHPAMTTTVADRTSQVTLESTDGIMTATAFIDSGVDRTRPAEAHP